MTNLTVETLNKDRLRNAAGERIYEQGQAYLDWGRVQIQNVGKHLATCLVFDSTSYLVEISLDDKYLYLRCDCRYASQGKICKHDVAAALAVHEHLRKKLPPHWSEQLDKVLSKTVTSPRAATPYLLFFSLQNTSYAATETWQISPHKLHLNALPEEMIRANGQFDEQAAYAFIENNPELIPQIKSPYSSINPRGCCNCGEESVVLANMMIERSRSYQYYYHGSPLEEYLALIQSTHSPLFLRGVDGVFEENLEVERGQAEMCFDIARGSQGIRISARIVLGGRSFPLSLPDEHTDEETEKALTPAKQGHSQERSGETGIQFISSHPLWILTDRSLIRMKDDEQSELLEMWIQKPEVVIPAEDEDRFLQKFYLPMARKVRLEGDLVAWETVEAQPVRRVYLSDAKGKLQAQLRFGYGDYEVIYEAGQQAEAILRKENSWTLVRVLRQVDFEEETFKALSSSTYRLKRAPKPAKSGNFVLRANAHPVDFLMYSVPRLAQGGFEVYGEEGLKTAHVNRNRPTLSFNVSSGIDWFDVKTVVSFGDLEVTLKEVRRALRKKERYVKLADGSIGELPPEWLERYKHLFALGEETAEGVRLSNHHLTLIDQLLENSERARTDLEFERRRQRLHSFSGITPVDLPVGFSGELRPYQKAGYDWLHFLREFNFGGCLADDMGLGKTVQVLVFLQSLKEGCGDRDRQSSQEMASSLVVVPRSLLVNWQREAARFTPGLKILEYFEANRPKDLEIFDQVDVVITTYGVMLRDIELLRSYTFNYVLLDESQAIKNPMALTSKAARSLKARHRLALTGTPVENSTVELWSQFAYLNPGLLGNLEYFKTEFGTPIEKKSDENAAQFLRKMVYPFILRRTKDQVAPELPPRSERILYADMEPAQHKLYNRTRDYYRGLIMGMLDQEGLNRSRMKILEGLLRLRQISNHPLLMDSKFRGESGKFDLLLETLETLRSEGHKALVFSQFVQMLRLVRQPLDQQKTPYAYLDGHTHNRQDIVDAFQTDENIPFFLISLKAGGQGLNLTAADYVIHIDPWWNPAVEMQASDRTHRIGQDKPVFVYKLITRDSVEEKILNLQEHKKELVEQLITTESGFFKSLTPEDVQTLFN
jgi:non-specific serine/threonine protein kinase